VGADRYIIYLGGGSRVSGALAAKDAASLDLNGEDRNADWLEFFVAELTRR